MLRLQSMSTGSKSLALALLVGLSPPAIFVPTASLALPLLQTSAETIAQDSLTGQVIDQDSDSAVGTVGTIIQSSSTEGTGNVGGSTGGNSTATAEFGRLALGATAMFDANGSAENQEFATFASASASMKDTFTIVTGGTGFQSGFFSVVLRLSGDQSASLSSPGFGRTGSLYRLDAKIANDCSGPITAGCAEFTGAVDDRRCSQAATS